MNKKNSCCIVYVALALCSLVTSAVPCNADFILNPTFVNGGSQVWNSTTQGVVQQAINDWRQVITGVNGTTQTVNFNVTFTNAGTNGFLGQWQGGFSASIGADIRPWSPQVTHTLFFNSDLMNAALANKLWFDPTPSTTGDQPFSDWDALSVARHEIGHMLGFTDLYVDNFFQANQSNPWTSRIVNNVFDPGGLNVSMNPDQVHLGSSGSLMSPSLLNGVRIGISGSEANMLSLAYGYNLAAVPEPTSLVMFSALIGVGYVWRIRRIRAAKPLAD